MLASLAKEKEKRLYEFLVCYKSHRIRRPNLIRSRVIYPAHDGHIIADDCTIFQVPSHNDVAIDFR